MERFKQTSQLITPMSCWTSLGILSRLPHRGKAAGGAVINWG